MYGNKKEKNLPINKIPLSTSFNLKFLFLGYNLLFNKRKKDHSLIEEYDGQIRKFPKVCHYLEYQRKPKEKINKLLLRAKSFDD
jgi:hypothetical protein